MTAAPSALVETDDPRLEASARALLTADGFVAGDGVVCVLLTCRATARVPRIRAAVLRHAGSPVVAAMPAGDGGAALRHALAAGVRGIVPDGELAATLVPTARAVLAGQLVVPPSLRRRLAPPSLSHREKEILRLVVDGYTNRQIADALFVAESTVKTHLSSAFGKLDARSRAEAAAILLDPEAGFGATVLGPEFTTRRSAA